MSTFSVDRYSTTWSCLSSLSLSEVSNVSIINLAITVEDVSNPQRSSQTWSNDQAGPWWPSLQHFPVADPRLVSGQHEAQQQNLPQSAPRDSETDSTITVTKSIDAEGETSSSLENESPSHALSETTEYENACGTRSPESSLEQDTDAYPCKGCAEVGPIQSASLNSGFVL